MADVVFPGDLPVQDLGTSRLPSNFDLTIWKGDAQSFVVKMSDKDGQPIDLSDKTAQATIRPDFESTPAYDFTCTIQNDNEVLIYMSSAISETLAAGTYVWNFQTTDTITGDVRTFLAGDVTVLPEVD